jgi:hypothetical protein
MTVRRIFKRFSGLFPKPQKITNDVNPDPKYPGGRSHLHGLRERKCPL